jgi:putative ABC transport system permease protein
VQDRLTDERVKVFTRAEIEQAERDYWVNRTALGQFFYFGVLLAVTVGGIFIYQMMVADIKKHLPEYATLKAMGYQFGFLFRVVLWQSVYLSVAGYALGLIGGLGLYEVTKAAARLPIGMTWERVGIVLGLTVGMCVLSCLLAVRKVRTADPADLF